MNYSEIKAVKSFCENLFSTPNWREVLENVLSDVDDFEVNNVRFISEDTIDEILADELENDEYLLGCFNASAIADATGWPQVLIEAAQKGEAYQEIGEAMTKRHIRDLAEIYSSSDGYGHHFNGYDFGEEEITVDGTLYHVFDNR